MTYYNFQASDYESDVKSVHLLYKGPFVFVQEFVAVAVMIDSGYSCSFCSVCTIVALVFQNYLDLAVCD